VTHSFNFFVFVVLYISVSSLSFKKFYHNYLLWDLLDDHSVIGVFRSPFFDLQTSTSLHLPLQAATYPRLGSLSATVPSSNASLNHSKYCTQPIIRRVFFLPKMLALEPCGYVARQSPRTDVAEPL
jgi:hypothetical protein